MNNKIESEFIEAHGSYAFKIGAFDCLAVSDGTLTFPAQWYAANAAEADVGKVLENNFLPAQTVVNQTTTLLIKTGKRTVLIDTGLDDGNKSLLGEIAAATAPLGKSKAHLQAAGIKPEDIDSIVLTHGHPDHVGGLTDAAGNLNYPNAQYYMTKTDWEFWNNAPIPKGQELNFHVARKTLPVIKDRVTLIDYGTEIVPGITALAASGHTPGHMGLIIASGNETLLHTCDAAAHFVLSLAHPDWYFIGDSEPQTAMKTRRKLFDQAAVDKSLTFASHFPFPSLGYVKRSGLTSWEWQPIVYAWQ